MSPCISTTQSSVADKISTCRKSVQIGLHPVVPGRPTHLLPTMSVDVDQRCAIDDKNHTGRRWHLELSSSAHFMMIVSIFLARFP